MLFVLASLLLTPIGAVVTLWALVAVGLSVAGRFRVATNYIACSLVFVWVASFAVIVLYNGVKGPNGFVIEGPEFFGIVFFNIIASLFATVVWAVCAAIGLFRKYFSAAAAASPESY